MGTVPPTKTKLKISRDGRTSTTMVPLPKILIDTREQLPYLFDLFPNWVSSTEVATIQTGDYTVEGYEGRISLERKTLQDIVGSLTNNRARFLREMDRMSKIESACLCIEATREELKSPYTFASDVKSYPNAICGSLDALASKYGNINIMYAGTRELGEEFAASWLNKCAALNWLEDNGHGRFIIEGDI